MPKRIRVATHLNLEELEQRYRPASDGIQSRQYQIICLWRSGSKRTESYAKTNFA
ncbi:MAG: hypothetical protein RM368_15530 [Nostoc sp. DedSLP03]|uniref:hypothetical protein n=1 Tax=Nostoc sp. DedSLP03 TaxID=3075400 RepID=UPI002AD5A25D|nr:hypothetical protein [Nostoc sp. DedSLP03]MDZ7966364.1 hypothetical protein [Nostoc sp. DedSLP03]